jgi:putative spermidine/putrescine transport system substrate-binding protein
VGIGQKTGAQKGEMTMDNILKTGVSRRAVLGASVMGAAVLAMPNVLRAQDKSLKVGVYGGYFKDSFDKNIFPEFTKATGITVESIAEPTGEAWLVQLEQAAKAGAAPADLSMMSQVAMLKGQTTKLWTPLDTAKMPNSKNLLDRFVNKYPDGAVAGIGAVSWYITLVTNTDVYKEAPTSWAAFWDKANADNLGLLALVSYSFLLEITAKTFFGGTNALDTEEGLLKAFD